MITTVRLPEAFAEFEHSGWEALSPNYDNCWGQVTSSFIPTMIADIPSLAGKHLLDLATGPGYAAGFAAMKGAVALGVDFSSEMVVQANKLHPRARFVVGDAHDLPFADSEFDVVVSNFGFQHFADPLLAVLETGRILRPGGILKFTLWAESFRNAATLILETALDKFATQPTPVPDGPDYHRLLNKSELKQILSRAHFLAASLDIKLHVIPWSLSDPDQLFRAEISGSVRSGAQLRQESGPALHRIRQAMSADIEANYSEDGRWVIPMAAYVISVKKNER